MIVGLSTYVSKSRTEQKKLKTCALFSLIVIVFAVSVIEIHNHAIEHNKSKVMTFDKREVGIIVLPIEGDSDNSLRRDFVDSLFSKLQQDDLTNVILKTFDNRTDGLSIGPANAAKVARDIGKQYNAKIVVWGDKVGDRKFWPHITIVDQYSFSSLTLKGNVELGVQQIDQLQLPVELVDEPICIAYLVSALSFIENDKYNDAITALDKASQLLNTNSPVWSDIKFYSGTCNLKFAIDNKQPLPLLQESISDLSDALNRTTPGTNSLRWAIVNENIGSAYYFHARCSKGDVASNNLLQSIQHLNIARKVFSLGKSSTEIGEVNLTLGEALYDLAAISNDQDEYKILTNSMGVLSDALQKLNKDKAPLSWAFAQNAYGVTLRCNALDPQCTNTDLLLNNALGRYKRALEVFNKEKNPIQYGMAKGNIGTANYDLLKRAKLNDINVYASNSLIAYEDALSAFVSIDSKENVAQTQLWLANVRSYMAELKYYAPIAENLLKEADANYKKALEYYTLADYPKDWASANNNDAIVLVHQAKALNHTNAQVLLDGAYTAYLNSLKVYNTNTDLQEWAGVQGNLGALLLEEAARSDETNIDNLLLQSASYSQSAIEVLSKHGMSKSLADSQCILAQAQAEIADRSSGQKCLQALTQSVIAAKAALDWYSKDLYPNNWAQAQMTLANSLAEVASYNNDSNSVSLLKESIVADRNALTVFSFREYPEVSATIQFNIGTEFAIIARMSEGKEALYAIHASIGAYEHLLTVCTNGQYSDIEQTASSNLTQMRSVLQKLLSE
jgi:hypothetical protein